MLVSHVKGEPPLSSRKFPGDGRLTFPTAVLSPFSPAPSTAPASPLLCLSLSGGEKEEG